MLIEMNRNNGVIIYFDQETNTNLNWPDIVNSSIHVGILIRYMYVDLFLLYLFAVCIVPIVFDRSKAKCEIKYYYYQVAVAACISKNKHKVLKRSCGHLLSVQ